MSERVIKSLVLVTIAALIIVALVTRGLPGSRSGQQTQGGSVITAGSVLNLGEGEFTSTLSATSKPVLVDFWATWCPPCVKMGPEIEALASAMGDRAVIAKVDADQAPNLARQYKISALPTVVIFLDGKEVDRVVGYQSKDALQRRLESAMR
ncbi:MAG: thioredoxin [Phycisphaeraceae bacterium]|nr:thioredoxin [Phycisphaeraceae bacterium]